MLPDYDESDDAIGLESLPQMPEAYNLNGYDELEQLLEHEYYLHDIAMRDYELELHENYEILQGLEEGEEEAEDYPPVQEEYLPEEEDYLPEEEIYTPGRDELLPEVEALLPDLLDATYAHAVNTVFTSAQAFNEARRMFLVNHSVAEIEAAFALGAALQAEPRMFLLQPGIYRASMETSFGDVVSREALAARPAMLESRETLTEYMTFEVAVPAASRGNEIQAHNERGARETITLPSLPIITPNRYALDNALPITVENRHTVISHPFDIEAVNLNSRASNDELAEIMAYGDAIMSLGQEQVQAIAPLSEPQRPLVVNPFTIDFSASESVSINTGAAMYRTHILSLPGRGGFGFNLDLLYSSARADYETLILMDGQMSFSEPGGADVLSVSDFVADLNNRDLSYVTTYHANLFETNWLYVDGQLIGSSTIFTGNRTWNSSNETQAGLESATGYSWDYVIIDLQTIQILSQRWADTWQSNELIIADNAISAYIPIMPLLNTATPRRNLHGLGAGWIFDLPYILDNVLYVPGRGSFALNGNTIVGYTLHDMTLRNYQGFFGNLWSDRRLDFHNGTSYFFNR